MGKIRSKLWYDVVCSTGEGGVTARSRLIVSKKCEMVRGQRICFFRPGRNDHRPFFISAHYIKINSKDMIMQKSIHNMLRFAKRQAQHLVEGRERYFKVKSGSLITENFDQKLPDFLQLLV